MLCSSISKINLSHQHAIPFKENQRHQYLSAFILYIVCSVSNLLFIQSVFCSNCTASHAQFTNYGHGTNSFDNVFDVK